MKRFSIKKYYFSYIGRAERLEFLVGYIGLIIFIFIFLNLSYFLEYLVWRDRAHADFWVDIHTILCAICFAFILFSHNNLISKRLQDIGFSEAWIVIFWILNIMGLAYGIFEKHLNVEHARVPVVLSVFNVLNLIFLFIKKGKGKSQ